MNKPLITFLFIVSCLASSGQYKKFSFQQPKMGSPFNIVLYGLDSTKAEEAAMSVFRMIDTLNQIYSDYLPSSELNKLCATAGSGKWVEVSTPLFNILKKAYNAGKISAGSFDITVSPVVRLWRNARREKRLPDKDSLATARQKVSYKYIELDSASQSVRLKKAGMQLDLGGIAKGETAERAYLRLCTLGFPYSLIDAGGDIFAGKVPKEVKGWRVAINLPESEELMDKQLLLLNKAVTTSGDLYQYVEINGKRYSHIINPVTGVALTNSRNVTVIANNGTDADWLTKACSILPIKDAIKLVKKFPSAEVQIAVLQNNKPRFYRSLGFTTYLTLLTNVNRQKI